MTKQEEIRIWLEHNFHETNARVILDYLHSQGAVIKVGGISEDLAQTASQSEIYCADKVGLSWERTAHLFKAFKEAGYVAVEPLIEE